MVQVTLSLGPRSIEYVEAPGRRAFPSTPEPGASTGPTVLPEGKRGQRLVTHEFPKGVDKGGENLWEPPRLAVGWPVEALVTMKSDAT